MAVEDGVAVEDVSLWSVRYRLVDPQQLHAALAPSYPALWTMSPPRWRTDGRN
ncbi:hypothetical protein ACH4TV_41125 [Streptomyces sp. NPDC020898]|uniref:hypothetical protein n=1 Tax=Streptomyces sp. NPDC020898 TaxID=3365101 RepID=UPI0037B8C206